MEIKAVNNLTQANSKQVQNGIETVPGFEGLIAALMQTDAVSDPIMVKGESREPNALLDELNVQVTSALKQVFNQNVEVDEADNDILLEAALKGKFDGRCIKASDMSNPYKMFLEKYMRYPDFKGTTQIITGSEAEESDFVPYVPEKGSSDSTPNESLINSMDLAMNSIGLMKCSMTVDEVLDNKIYEAVNLIEFQSGFKLGEYPQSADINSNAQGSQALKAAESEAGLDLNEIFKASENFTNSVLYPSPAGSFSEIIDRVVAEVSGNEKLTKVFQREVLDTVENSGEVLDTMASSGEKGSGNKLVFTKTFEIPGKNLGEAGHTLREIPKVTKNISEELNTGTTVGGINAAVGKESNEGRRANAHRSINDISGQVDLVKTSNISDQSLITGAISVSREGIPTKNVSDIPNHEAIISELNKDELIDTTVRSFKALRLPEVTELKVRLKPHELGDISISVVLEKGQISGNITASNREVYNILQNSVDNMKQELRNNNLNFSNISVNIGSNGDFGSSGTFQHQGQSFKGYKGSRQNYSEEIHEHMISDEEEGIDIIA